ncbi:hypothetical protein EJ05DRAFT_420031, partial [Pseudovirgaria hyperparasitica]
HTGQQNGYLQDTTIDPSAFNAFGTSLHNSPIDFMPVSQATMNTTLSMEGSSNFMAISSAMDMQQMTSFAFQMNDFQNELMYAGTTELGTNEYAVPCSSVGGSSPSENLLEIRSISSDENGNGWSFVDIPQSHRRSFGSYNTDNSNQIIHNPAMSLHIRTGSGSDESNHSDVPPSAISFGSGYEEVMFPMGSPQSEHHIEFTQHGTHGLSSTSSNHDRKSGDLQHYHPHTHSHHNSPTNASASPIPIVTQPKACTQGHNGLKSTSPTSSGVSSPPSARRRKSPTGARDKVQKTIQKKPVHSTKKDANASEKKVGRRRGPLRPDQRQQAHEIRKLRACLRCKFLKKTCDKGDPCGGCQPSHARLWQVPCTRIDIKDIAYFMKDWKADYERHVSLGFSVGNIKGFSQIERQIYVTHGYGFYLPINAREVYVRDDKCFGVDWVEQINEFPKTFECQTAKLSAGMEGISHAMLSEYLDRHIDGGFERFVDEYFDGTYFISEILKTAYRFYLREKLPVIRKALKLVLAYNLTLHVTMVEGLGDDDQYVGKVDDNASKFFGKTVAPVMINFQVKCALADMWRELQKDVLEELSSLYSSVYSGDKLKNWPTIFMLAAILLCVWELMQFDCHYRIPDQKAVEKFCNDMESTPVGVIVGLFSAISQKLPSFSEWDTRKHHHLLASNPAVCDAMTEVRAHVHKYDSYLRSRADSKFDREDFDSLSNKFLSKLV